MQRPYKVYRFHTSYLTGWQPQLVVMNFDEGKDTFFSLTERTYARFVQLANSGKYRVRISEEEGIAWEMER